MKCKSEKSIQQQLHYFIIIVLAVCGAAIALCIAVSTHLVNNSHLFLDSVGILSDFYQNVDVMDGYARAFVSGADEQDYDIYEEKRNLAKSNLEEISNIFALEDLTFRMNLLGNMLDTYHEEISAFIEDEKNWYSCYKKLEYTNFLIYDTSTQYHNLVAQAMRSEMLQKKQTWIRWMAIIGSIMVGMLISGALLAHNYVKKITQPIEEMMKDMNQIQQGNYNIQAVNYGARELKALSATLAELAYEVQNNIELLKYNMELDKKLLERENENLNIKNLLYKTQLKSLQAQINPHFLFNTLNLIAKKAVLSGDEETSLLMENVSALLRYGLDKANKISTLQEEIICIENYFFIQQRRFTERIKFILDVEPELPNVPMPAMVLQPLVENSIIHGIKDMLEDAEVSLTVNKCGEYLRILIEDNGQGMDSETLENLMSSFCMQDMIEEQEGNHIGVSNVYRRLLMYYGKEMHFSLESEEGCGTIVTLEIPMEVGDEEWHIV